MNAAPCYVQQIRINSKEERERENGDVRCETYTTCHFQIEEILFLFTLYDFPKNSIDAHAKAYIQKYQ